MSAKSKILAAKVSLALEHPFWGNLIGNLALEETLTVPTAATNGVTLKYNPVYFENLSHDLTVGILAHEVSHCAQGHHFRRGGRDPKLWNVAADLSINGDLRKEFKLPEGVLYPSPEQEGKNAEWIYARLLDSQPQPPQPKPTPDEDGEDSQPGEDSGEGQGEDGEGEGQGNPVPGTGDPCGTIEDAPTEVDAQGNEPLTENEWKQLAAESLQASNLMGKGPGGMERAIKESLKPRLDVRSLLLRFMQEHADYTWTRPNSRYLPMNLYLPKLHSQGMGELAVLIDTSGSVDAVSLQFAAGIIESVIEETAPLRISLYFVDSDVCHIERFEYGESLVWPVDKRLGGGGTDFRSAFTAMETDETPVCIIAITDLFAVFPEVPPAIPTLWLSTTPDMIAPFGETVYIDR